MITWKGCHSNNFGVGRAGHKVDKIVVHWIVGTLESANITFQNPDRKASAHYGIGGTKIFQWVKEEDTAWHASNLTVNRQSIGIEHEGGPTLPISDATYKTSAKLIKEICQRYNLPLDRSHIRAHKEFANTQCPGTLDIDRLISLAKGEDMTEEQKRILQFLAEQKANEGKVREAFGALADIPKLQKEVSGLKSSIVDLASRLSDLELKLAQSEKSGESYQSQLKTANKTNQTLSADLAYYKPYKALYEKKLQETVDKYSALELLRLGIRKLFVKK
jgi:N-acetylmuramoyl-L-alanine amidase CwlA